MKDSEETKRLFLGIPLPADIIEFLNEMKVANQELGSVRWVPEPNWHITVHFFGDVPVTYIQDLILHLIPVIQSTPAFSLVFQKFLLAPKRNPRMIWGQFAPHESFTKLVQEIRGLADETKNSFKEPKIHVTLARFRYLKSPQLVKFPDLSVSGPMPVTRLTLWESTLTPKGAIYKVMEEFSLMR